MYLLYLLHLVYRWFMPGWMNAKSSQAKQHLQWTAVYFVLMIASHPRILEEYAKKRTSWGVPTIPTPYYHVMYEVP